MTLTDNHLDEIKELRTLTKTLSSKEEQLRFLKSIYKPGRKAVVALIFELEPKGNERIFEKELVFAISAEDHALVRKYGTKVIDYYLISGYLLLIPDKLKAWKNSFLTEYTFSKIPVSKKLRDIQNAVHFYEEMGIVNETYQSLVEKALQYEVAQTEFPHMAVHRLKKLGRYDEAIDYCLYVGRNYLGDAWEFAKEHVPTRKAEIAKKIMKAWHSEDIDHVIFVESAEFLGKIDETKKHLIDYIEEIPGNSGRFYYDLVKALGLLGLKSEIRHVLKMVREYTRAQTGFIADAYGEMAELCAIAGEHEESKEWTIKKLTYEVRQCHSSHGLGTIKKYEERTGDTSLREMLFPLYDREQDYTKARDLAKELGLTDKAKNYEKMILMISAK
jgi:tetratricopeptide (TPR) repeat protein